ncbi:sensor histidine kinase [Paenibacillus whitsoniae]|uniref:histidine kinase n=1 Tax=Paenibacillus whitsoniae TaxID=2496558 RepID=A0A3S0ACZ5_9BACL|nr:sensor histidine kinase [Paenibacillus whitsoniae]RTE10099.1 sensor histidine kinase [Paenibacillus whitsoniae]
MNTLSDMKKKPFEHMWFAWFFYLIFPIMSLISKPPALMWTGFALLAVFAAFILLGFKNEKHRWLYTVGLFPIIAFLTITCNPFLICMFFYSVPLISLLPSKQQFRGVLSGLFLSVILVICLDFKQYFDEGAWYMFPSLAIMFYIPFAMRARRKSNELKEKLILANDEIARLATIEERQRISRDLHDTLGHTLSLITLKSELAEKLMLKSPERAMQEVKDIQTTSRAALQQVRELISGMNAISLREEIAQSSEILKSAGIAFETHGHVHEFQAPPMVHNIFGMCLREAVTNVVKHSRASLCTVSLQEEPGDWTLIIADNGEPCKDATPHIPSSGRGLLGMKERLELIDGTLTFHTGRGAGTRLIIRVPRIIRHPQV